MTDAPYRTPHILTARQRETGVACALCGEEVVGGETVCVCRACGGLHHERCWDPERGCAAYECAGPRAADDRLRDVAIRVTRDELQQATPLAPKAPPRGGEDGLHRRWNRAGVWAFVVAVVGAPLFGLLTGFVAMVLACVALASHRPNQRGVTLAVLGMVLGLADIVGWSVGLSYYYGSHVANVALPQAIDPETLENMPEHVARAMRANVEISSQMGFGRGGMGSGVVLKVVDGLSYIVTNRHVVDSRYSGDELTAPDDFSKLAKLTVGSIEALQAPAAIEWIAPNGVDLALISARLPEGVVDEAHWDLEKPPAVGDAVFAIGNPHGLGWTHTSGSVSQVRRQVSGGYSFRVLQTSAAINPGNSGGGLYDAQGRLVGINTMTVEKRFAEGLGFSIAFRTLVDLIPSEYEVHRKNPPEDPDTDRRDR